MFSLVAAVVAATATAAVAIAFKKIRKTIFVPNRFIYNVFMFYGHIYSMAHTNYASFITAMHTHTDWHRQSVYAMPCVYIP